MEIYPPPPSRHYHLDLLRPQQLLAILEMLKIGLMMPTIESGFGSSYSSLVHLRHYRLSTKLGFIQLCSIAHRINEAFEQCARYFYHVGCL